MGRDVAEGMAKMCGWDLTVVQTSWDQCWDDGKLGQGLLNGNFHGCMTYQHSHGERERHAEFSDGFLEYRKPAGLLVRLDANGEPEINGNDNL